MTHDDNDVLERATERFERRLAEENGKLRIEMATGFGNVCAQIAAEGGAIRATMESGFGSLRAEMIDRDAAMLRWLLLFVAGQTAALAAWIQFTK